jgi:hypothetical protein
MSLVKIARNVAVAVLAMLAIVLMLEAVGTGSLRRRAALIQVGDGKDRVRSLLGRPTESLKTEGLGILFTGGAPEWWSYGSLLGWHRPFTREFPWKAPLKFRPDTNDVAVYFDSMGKVVRVYIPKT